MTLIEQIFGLSDKLIPSGGTTGQVLSKVDSSDYNTQWTTISGGGTGIELDPVFQASVASAISLQDYTDWTIAYSWGDHATIGYLTTETDPVFLTSVAYTISSTNVTNWNTAYFDSHVHSNFDIIEGIIDSGFGDQFLSDDGTYKSLTVLPTGTDGYVLFNDLGTMGTDSTFYFDKVTSTLTYEDGDVQGYLYFNSTDVYIRNNGSGDLTFFDGNAGLITLSDLITGSTNYWTQIGSDIHYSSGNVGINTTTFTESLNVSGNILADDFNSKYYRFNAYDNICIGDTAGDGITTTNLLFIDNNALGTASTFPLIKGDFLSRYVEINGELTLNYGILNFEDANQKIYSDLGYLYVQDQYINSGSPITFVSFIDGTYNSLKTDFASYLNVAAITAANISNWNSAYGGIHNPVTIGTANGLSLATQALSLALASTSTTGALSSTDWNTFNNKQATITADVDYLTPGTAATTYEPALGNPGTTGYVLSSTDAGVRSWIAVSSGVTPIDGILDWSTDVYQPYAAHPGSTVLQFYSGTTTPTGTTRLNLNGNLYTNNLNSGVLTATEANISKADRALSIYGGNGAATYPLVRILNNATLTANESNNSILNLSRTCDGQSLYTANGSMLLIEDSPVNQASTVIGSSISIVIDGNEKVRLYPRIVNSGTNKAYVFDTRNTLSGTTRLLSIQNNTVERFRVTPTTTDMGDIIGGNIVTVTNGDLTSTGTITPGGRLMIPMGEISYFNTTGTTITITGVSDGSTNMVLVNPTTTLNNDMEFDNGGGNTGRLRYIGTATRTFHVACSISFSGATTNQDGVFGIAKNGTIVAASKVISFLGLTSDTRSTALHLMVSLTTNDYVELYVGNMTATNNVVVKTLNIFAMGM
jgi:hypothetical protein